MYHQMVKIYKKAMSVNFRFLKQITLFIFILSFTGLKAQTYDAGYAQLSFLAARKTHKVGTNGSAAGNKTLYTNVVTISGQVIDCIVTTVSISGGTFTLPGSAAGGTIAFDYSSATGTGMSANNDRFFSPCFNFNTGGGSCKFNFQFISGGSYNNGTNTGTNVSLKNFYINTFDIDGNGTSGTNQFNEIGGFVTAQLKTSTGSNITYSYNSSTGLIKFRSTSDQNTSTVTDDANRIKVDYSNAITSIDYIVGSEGTGPAYFFLDFGTGVSWTTTPTTLNITALPVELISFSAKKIDNTVVKINWATASEINNSHFEVERSIDGRIFTKIDEVNSKGINGLSSIILNYSTLDKEVSKLGVSKIFYRIKQVDYDGKFEYTNTEVVHLNTFNSVTISPNPTNGDLTLELNNLIFDESFQIAISDLSGRIIAQQSYNLNTGSISREMLSLKDFENGYYFITVSDSKSSKVFKVLKH